MLCVVLLACYFQILMKTVNGLCSLQIMANTLYTIKSALFTVSWLCQHNLITICNSSSVNLKFTIRKDTFYSLVWWSKACANLPSYRSCSNKGRWVHELCFANCTHRDTQWARNIPGARSDGKLTISRSDVKGKQPGGDLQNGKEHHMHEVSYTLKNCKQLLNPLTVVLSDQLGISDGQNCNVNYGCT